MTKRLFAAALAAVMLLSGCSDTQQSETAEGSLNNAANNGISFDDRFNLVYEEDSFIIRTSEDWEFFDQNGADCAFQYISAQEEESEDASATVVGIQKLSSGGNTLDVYTDSMRKAYDGIYTIADEGPKKISIYDGYFFKLKYPDEELSDIFLMQEFIIQGDNAFAFSITCLESDADKMLPEINDFLSSFEIK